MPTHRYANIPPCGIIHCQASGTHMSPTRIFILTSLALLAFAGNSLLCRLALKTTSIDAASFTSIRLISGAIILCLIVMLKDKTASTKGSWLSALALLVYAAGFSFAYRNLSAATGALLLFSAVQATMIAWGFSKGERFQKMQWLGLFIAITGFIGLLLPGLSAPPLNGSLLMLAAGIAWGVYSLRGKTDGNALQTTAGNFLRAAPMAIVCSLLMMNDMQLDTSGIVFALCSGALTSGIGYVIWYAALPALKATTAASVQLAVPAITAMGGILLLDEPLSLRIVLASMAILGGIALIISIKKQTVSR
jgi:drug/metabolite transporter (DMT)-like permease